MRKFPLWLLVFICLAFQVTLFSKIEIGGIRPDSVLIILVYVSLCYGPVTGALLGFFIGLAQYSILSSCVASLPLAGTVVGYLVGQYGRKVLYESYAVQVLIVFIAVVVFDVINFIWFSPAELLSSLIRISVPTALYTALVGVVAVFIVENVLGLKLARRNG